MHVLTPERRELAYHQRCTSCGATSRAGKMRSAVTFRHRHRKACPEAQFEGFL
jgi:hypothetical protein